MNYPKPTTKDVYHIFTNNRDEWLTEKEGAFKLYQEWKKEYTTARLYSTEWNGIDGTWDDTGCLKTYGPWPS